MELLPWDTLWDALDPDRSPPCCLSCRGLREGTEWCRCALEPAWEQLPSSNAKHDHSNNRPYHQSHPSHTLSNTYACVLHCITPSPSSSPWFSSEASLVGHLHHHIIQELHIPRPLRLLIHALNISPLSLHLNHPSSQSRSR